LFLREVIISCFLPVNEPRSLFLVKFHSWQSSNKVMPVSYLHRSLSILGSVQSSLILGRHAEAALARNDRSARCGLLGPRLININRQTERNQFARGPLARKMRSFLRGTRALSPYFQDLLNDSGSPTYRGAACLYYFTGCVPQISGRHAIPRPSRPPATPGVPASAFRTSRRSRAVGTIAWYRH